MSVGKALALSKLPKTIYDTTAVCGLLLSILLRGTSTSAIAMPSIMQVDAPATTDVVSEVETAAGRKIPPSKKVLYAKVADIVTILRLEDEQYCAGSTCLTYIVDLRPESLSGFTAIVAGPTVVISDLTSNDFPLGGVLDFKGKTSVIEVLITKKFVAVQSTEFF